MNWSIIDENLIVLVSAAGVVDDENESMSEVEGNSPCYKYSFVTMTFISLFAFPISSCVRAVYPNRLKNAYF